MLPFSQNKDTKPSNSPKQTKPQNTSNIFNIRKTSSSSQQNSHASLPTTTASSPIINQNLNNSYQASNLNNSFTYTPAGLSAPPIQKDYTLPPFGSNDNHSQQGSFRRNDRESLMTPSFIPSPEVPVIPNQYKEIPASEPDLSKKPIKSALKGSKIHQQQNRSYSPSSNKNVPSFESSNYVVL